MRMSKVRKFTEIEKQQRVKTQELGTVPREGARGMTWSKVFIHFSRVLLNLYAN
jgi:hypothetical protein